jgi:hypothetical protein
VIESLRRFPGRAATFAERAVACDQLDHARAPIFFLKPEAAAALADERGRIQRRAREVVHPGQDRRRPQARLARLLLVVRPFLVEPDRVEPASGHLGGHLGAVAPERRAQRGLAPASVRFDRWCAGLEDLKASRGHGWRWLTQRAGRPAGRPRRGRQAAARGGADAGARGAGAARPQRRRQPRLPTGTPRAGG